MKEASSLHRSGVGERAACKAITRRTLMGGGAVFALAGFAHASQAIEVSPTGNDDDDMLDSAALVAARKGVPLRMAAAGYRRRTPWRLPPGLELDADPAAVLNASAGCRTGIVIPAGNAKGRSRLPALGLFSDCGLSIEGAALLDLEIPSIGGCGTAIRMTSANGSLLDNRIRFNAIFDCDIACALRGTKPTDVIQGNVFEGNFVTKTRSTAVYEGTMCFCDGNRFSFEAVDITSDKGGGGFLLNRMTPATSDPNPNGTSVPRATFVVREWAGGEGFAIGAVGGPAQLLGGRFNGAIFDVRGTRSFSLSNYKQPTNAIVDSEIRLNMVGNKNGPYHAISGDDIHAATGLSSFNRGQPVALDSFIVVIEKSLLRTLRVEKSTAFFVYALFTDLYDSPWHVRAIGGAIDEIEIVACLDESDVEDHRLAIHLRSRGTAVRSDQHLQLTMARRPL